MFEVYNNNTLSFWITILFKKNNDATQILRKNKIFLFSQSKAIKLNENNNTIVTIYFNESFNKNWKRTIYF